MQVFKDEKDAPKAAESILKNGFAVLDGTKTIAVRLGELIREELKNLPEICPVMSYQHVENNGYYYYVVDLNKFEVGSHHLQEIINNIDAKLRY